MAKRQIVWARRARKILLQKLGGCCSFCGTRSDLTFDCIDPTDHRHADRLGNHNRMPYYRRQHRAGNVQILCRHCNSVKGKRRNYWPPFNRHVKRRYLAMRRKEISAL
jgi:5-methylcytosine-specific restriction endonuclease McrA